MLSPSLQNKAKSVKRGLTVLMSARLDWMNLRVCAPLLDRSVPLQARYSLRMNHIYESKCFWHSLVCRRRLLATRMFRLGLQSGNNAGMHDDLTDMRMWVQQRT